jgi:hypothetical protein
MPLPAPSGVSQESIAQLAGSLDTAYPGQGLGQAYTNYANNVISKRPSTTPYQAFQAFGLILATGGVAKALAAGAQGLGSFEGAAVKASPAVASPLDVFHGLSLGNWFVRIGEILLGIVLVGVGVAKLTGANNIISTAVKAKI